jgi:hypothetical protein
LQQVPTVQSGLAAQCGIATTVVIDTTLEAAFFVGDAGGAALSVAARAQKRLTHSLLWQSLACVQGLSVGSLMTQTFSVPPSIVARAVQRPTVQGMGHIRKQCACPNAAHAKPWQVRRARSARCRFWIIGSVAVSAETARQRRQPEAEPQ